MTFNNLTALGDLLGTSSDAATIFTSGAIAALIAVGIILAIILFAGIYVYYALAWSTIAKKLKYKKPWLAWIPVAQLFLIPILAKKKWAWGFMFLVPIANIVFCIIWTWKVFERRKYPGWLSLSIIIPKVGGILYLIAIGFVAWGKKRK
ncbi:MAG: hypothetical protein ISS82_06325 [Nanoarchaeota archaeon]|nr:hypothetical protein [Nanoarchaeota archaeon]